MSNEEIIENSTKFLITPRMFSSASANDYSREKLGRNSKYNVFLYL